MIPRKEYPRPQMVRDNWMNLNGTWQFEMDGNDTGMERQLQNKPVLDGTILVPFVPESRLSGLENKDFMKVVWYKRMFSLKELQKGTLLLHFGAVNYSCDVWINGQFAGSHAGGYTPFMLDITSLVWERENAIVVRARNDVRDPLQPSGKQSPRYGNYGCMYDRCTGIWQTVWMEWVPKTYIQTIKITPDPENSSVHIQVRLSGNGNGQALRGEVLLHGLQVGTIFCSFRGAVTECTVSLSQVQLWSPESPVLYDLRLSVGEDRVESYFGMRSIELKDGAFLLNGKPLFLRMVLDQGYFPDGIYTPLEDEALKNDILLSKKLGFLGARMHMKVFEPRFIYWEDRLGYLLWGEYPNWGLDDTRPEALLSMLPEWLEEVRRDYNSPAIIGWCPFNETAQARIPRLYETVYAATRAYDAMRPIIDSSGWTHAGAVSDMYDVHNYEQDPTLFAKKFQSLLTGDGAVYVNFPEQECYHGQPYWVSEFGGIHWDPVHMEAEKTTSWGYGKSPQSIEEFYARLEGLVAALTDHPKICGYCYTQLTDVYQEKNGLYKFDRGEKFDSERLRKIFSRKAAIEN